ncbi:glycosyltransferase family 1 protein [Spirosoma flavus]
MKRILFVLDNYYPHIGGAELLFQNLAEQLAAEGYYVTVLTPRSFPNYKASETYNGVHIIRPWVPNFLQRYFFTLFAIPKAISLARKHDIIHTATYNAAFPAWIASLLTGRKSVITIYEVWGQNWFRFGDSKVLSTVLYVLEKMVLALKFNQHVCISESTLRAFREVHPTRRATRIYPGVDYSEIDEARQRDQPNLAALRERFGFKPDDFVVLGFGRTGLSKGFEYLVRAIPMIHERAPKIRFVFIWPTAPNFVTLRDTLVEEISRFPKSIDVQVLDKKTRQELLSFIQAADCVVVPSLSEGFGYAVVESSCLCDKVVASNTTSIPEVIGGNHLLAEPANPASIADAVAKMQIGQYVTTPRPTTFTVQKMVDEHKEMYASL